MNIDEVTDPESSKVVDIFVAEKINNPANGLNRLKMIATLM